MIIVPGSVNADLLFKVARLPRPGETVLCPSYVMAPGGKGANQAAAAAKAGAEVAFVGHVGDDAYGPVVRGLLEAAGVDCDLLAVARRADRDRGDRRRRGRRERDHRRQRRQPRHRAAPRCPTRCSGPAPPSCARTRSGRPRPSRRWPAPSGWARGPCSTWRPAAPVPPEVAGRARRAGRQRARGRGRGRRRRAARPRTLARVAGHRLRPDLRRHPGRGRLHRGHRGRGLARAGAADPARSTRPAPATPSWACSPRGWTAAPTWSRPCAPPASPPPAAASRWAPRRRSRRGPRSWRACRSCRRSPRCDAAGPGSSRARMTGTLRFVLGDQLDRDVAALRDLDPARDMVLMAEVMAEATYVPHHPKKIAFVLSAMRHFAGELRADGVRVRYVELDDAGQHRSPSPASSPAPSRSWRPDGSSSPSPASGGCSRTCAAGRRPTGVPVEIRARRPLLLLDGASSPAGPAGGGSCAWSCSTARCAGAPAS